MLYPHPAGVNLKIIAQGKRAKRVQPWEKRSKKNTPARGISSIWNQGLFLIRRTSPRYIIHFHSSQGCTRFARLPWAIILRTSPKGDDSTKGETAI